MAMIVSNFFIDFMRICFFQYQNRFTPASRKSPQAPRKGTLQPPENRPRHDISPVPRSYPKPLFRHNTPAKSLKSPPCNLPKPPRSLRQALKKGSVPPAGSRKGVCDPRRLSEEIFYRMVRALEVAPFLFFGAPLGPAYSLLRLGCEICRPVVIH